MADNIIQYGLSTAKTFLLSVFYFKCIQYIPITAINGKC